MKSFREPIEVSLDGGRPETITWRNRTFRVRQVQDCWILQNRWWEQEEKRWYYLLHTSGADMEIYRSGHQWILSRLVD